MNGYWVWWACRVAITSRHSNLLMLGHSFLCCNFSNLSGSPFTGHWICNYISFTPQFPFLLANLVNCKLVSWLWLLSVSSLLFCYVFSSPIQLSKLGFIGYASTEALSDDWQTLDPPWPLSPESKTFIAEFDTGLKNIHPCRVSPGFIIRHAMETLKLSDLIYTLV